jgi:hypothetical protein
MRVWVSGEEEEKRRGRRPKLRNQVEQEEGTCKGKSKKSKKSKKTYIPLSERVSMDCRPAMTSNSTSL